jgi:hypothetical protein
VLALFQETGVVDDPRVDRLACGHRVEGVLRGLPPDIVIAPRRVECEMQKSLVLGIGTIRIRARAGSVGSMLFRSPSPNTPSA